MSIDFARMLGYRPSDRLIDLVMEFSWVDVIYLSRNTLDQKTVVLHSDIQVIFPFSVPLLNENLEGRENIDKKNCEKSLTENH